MIQAGAARRELTTVSTQALYLMNSEFVYEQAAGLVRRLSAVGDEQTRIDKLWQLALGRNPDQEEAADVGQFLVDHRKALGEMPAEADDQAAWPGVARTVLTRNEFLFVDGSIGREQQSHAYSRLDESYLWDVSSLSHHVDCRFGS